MPPSALSSTLATSSDPKSSIGRPTAFVLEHAAIEADRASAAR